MKLRLEIEGDKIYILYNGYNIIAETIYDEELAKEIYNLIQAGFYEDLADLTKLKRGNY